MKIKLTILSFVLILVSCQSFKKLPIDKTKILKDVEEHRKYNGPVEGLSFNDAQKLMSMNNLELKELRQEYEKLKSIAEIKTPLPNPSIELGYALGTSLDEKSAGKSQPFIGLGFTIPLGPRLARNDDLNEALMLRAYNNIVLKHRSLYFELKKAFSSYSMESTLLNKKKQLLEHFKLNSQTVNKMLEFGAATVIDVNSAKIQHSSMQISLYETQSELNQIKSRLGELLGKDLSSTSDFNVKADKLIIEDFKDLNLLKTTMVQNNFELSRLEMDYKIAEIELKLELAKQYPDIEIGSSAEQEPGEKKKIFSLGLSLDLPIFDRNQQSIASKDNERKVLLSKFNSVLSSSINKLNLLVSNYNIQKQKLSLIDNQILPISNDTVAKAKKAVQAGRLDILRFIDLSKELYENELEKIKASKQLQEIKLELEEVIGESLTGSK
ncbi:MAG: TolC family protein [Lentisphaeraceae bacterium]|nr:TolC family protein [Lentisphaeraceae bacterium]